MKVVRELQGVVASQGLKIGLLLYSGNLTTDASSFLQQPGVTIKAYDAADIYDQILELPEHTQATLLLESISGDYLTPSCPSCDLKLIEKTNRKNGNKFLGCPNFPSCRYVYR